MCVASLVACGGEAGSAPSSDTNDAAPIDSAIVDAHVDDTGTDTSPPRPDATPETSVDVDADASRDAADADAEVDAADAIATRTPLPWEGGTIGAMAVDATDDDRILVGGDFPGVWRSDDAGLHWTHVDVGGWGVTVRADRKRANVFWAMSGGHASRSFDGGVTWTEVLAAGSGIERVSLGADDKTIYAYVPADAVKGFYRSDDDGLTWTLTTGGDSDFVVAMDDPLVVLDETALERSNDGGMTWSAIVGVSKWSSTFVFDSSRPKTAWTVNDGSLMRSDDDGATFTTISALGFQTTLAVSRTGTLWVFDNHNSLGTRTIESSSDGGTTWSPVHTYADPSLWFGAVAVPRDDLVYVGWGPLGVRVSIDRGATYEDRIDGLDAARIDELAIAPSDPHRIWLAAARGVYRSLDGGASWSLRWAVAIRGWPWAIAIAPTDPSVVWLRTSESVVIGTTDDGATWPRLHDGVTGPGHSFVEGITIDPTASNVAYFGDASYVTRWRDGVEVPLAVSPTASQISCLLATSATHIIATDWNAIYATDDAGKTWTQLLAEPVAGYSVDTFAAAASDPRTIYFLRPSGVWKTTDGGATWASLDTGKSAIGMIAVARDDATKVWLATQEGVRRSTDGGATWSAAATGTAGSTMIAVSADGTTMVTIANGMGKPWISTDGGATFTPISP
jgi:photosystem II stability/assembly factor-like uncharacterized protein